ncbi:hypothetical protein EXM65_01705 [Clostridium botulinum]|uniref:Uncharacterized protein n=1 Tax=Clostridium botulinum TaxID=1491 RepID=A0A6M0SJD7_CLOBO|nr:hypothetical protein [Clostridium botulinum]
MSRILKIPGIKLDVDEKYKLFCGWCGSTNLKAIEIQKDINGNSKYEIYCQESCNPKGGNNAVCSIPKIEEIAKRDSGNNINIYFKMLEDVYEFLELNIKASFEYKRIMVKKEIVKLFNITNIENIEYLGEEKGINASHYFCKIEEKKYLIRVRFDGNVFIIGADEFSSGSKNWKHLNGMSIK